jgi:O-acetylserine/cysteine efflux transporter
LISLFLVMAGAFSWAVGQTLIRRLKNVDSLTVTTWVAVLSVPQLFLMSFIFEDGHLEAVRHASPQIWMTVLYLGAVMSALGYYIWNGLVIRNPVSQIAPTLLLLPIFSSLGGILFLGERPGPMELLGSGVILAGVYLVIVKARVAPPV